MTSRRQITRGPRLERSNIDRSQRLASISLRSPTTQTDCSLIDEDVDLNDFDEDLGSPRKRRRNSQSITPNKQSRKSIEIVDDNNFDNDGSLLGSPDDLSFNFDRSIQNEYDPTFVENRSALLEIDDGLGDNFQEIDAYNDLVNTHLDPLNNSPSIPINPINEEFEGSILEELSNTPRILPEFDDGEIIPHERVSLQSSRFTMALGFWCEETGISRSQYQALREILGLLEPHPELENLPKTLSTLQKHTRGQLPLLTLRKKKVELNPYKIPTTHERHKVAPFGEANEQPVEDFVYFDLSDSMSSFLAADEITSKMYFGLGNFVDVPTELWHSHSWTSSIRTTSGEYAHFPDSAEQFSSQPVFPSDFVEFKCDSDVCCLGSHIGLVCDVGLDQRENSPDPNKILLRVREIYRPRDIELLPGANISRLAYEQMMPPVSENEIVLSPNFHLIPETCLRRLILDIITDYQWNEPYGYGNIVQPSINQYLLRRTINYDSNTGDGSDICIVRPLYLTPPLRAELELRTYGRDHFVGIDARVQSSNESSYNVLSLPLMTFIDSFGVYRNSYRSLMGIYAMMGAFTYQERNRRSNVMPITLGPHGANFINVCKALASNFRGLEKGKILEIKGKKNILHSL